MTPQTRTLLQTLFVAAFAMAGAASGIDRPIPLILPETPIEENRPVLEHAESADYGLQVFTSAGHAVAFDEADYTVAGLDHALRVRFVGARLVRPLAASKLK